MQNTFANESLHRRAGSGGRHGSVGFPAEVPRPADTRGIELLQRLAKLANWQKRPAPQKSASGNVVTGRGMSYVKYELVRTYVGAVAEVEVDRKTGEIRVSKFYVAHDCGQIINPDGLKNQIEGNVDPDGEPHADRGTEVRPLARDEPRLGELPDPQVPAGAGDRRSI